ncbi:MAG: MFS transporter [Treponema sp.]|nr:MFS transporter [Treponema sp.]
MRNFTKEERSWVLYDWAEGVFTTIMMAAVFPVYFVSVAGGEGSPGSMWWAIGLVAARLTVGIAAPFLGAVIDYKGYKKRLFVIFLGAGVFFTALAAVVSSWQLLLVTYVFANIFWSVCNQIYDSFLPDITTKDRMDRVSATGFAMGYIGGGTIPFMLSIALLLFGENFGIDTTLAVRISVVMTAVWWAAFSIPIIKNVHHKYGDDLPEKDFFRQTFNNMVDTAKKIAKNKAVLTFMIAYFFYIDGVSTIINIATAYGAELGLPATGMIGALFLTQLVAVPFSLLFGRLSGKTNPLNLIAGAIVMYCVISSVGFVMGFGLEEGFFGTDTALILFFTLAFLVGTVQGGIQAISRSTFSKLIPPQESGEYFGFFEIFGRFAAIIGPSIYALVLAVTGRSSFGILSITVVFVTGLVILLRARKLVVFER